jgi:type VI secretion system secreted protein Hcp
MIMAVDYLLKITDPDIKGESKEKGFEDQIQALSWSWGATNSGSAALGGGEGTGKVRVQDFNFTMNMSTASNAILDSIATGKHHGKAILTCRKTTGAGTPEKYLEITFTEVVISGYQTGGHGDEGLPLEQISFNFAQYEVEYFEQDKKGVLKGKGKLGYNIKEARVT